jgi:hypothetical protein
MRPLLMVVVVACGSSQPAPKPSGGPPAPLEAQRATPDDVVVATVNGKPVYGSCVAIQAARAHIDRDAALRQCVDFELMAQAAAQRGLAVDPDVVTATHTALVGQLVASAYEDGMTMPAQFGPAWTAIVQRGKLAFHFKHEEYRASSYVRVKVAANAPADEDQRAHALADKIAAAVATEHGLLGPQLVEIAQRIAGPVVLAHQDVPPYKIGGLEDAYGNALFALTEIGRTTSAVRTANGWDVVVWTGMVPAATPSDAELTADLLPIVKQTYFNKWVDDIKAALHVKVELVPDNIDKLEALP